MTMDVRDLLEVRIVTHADLKVGLYGTNPESHLTNVPPNGNRDARPCGPARTL